MNNKTIKAILLDLGNVIVGVDETILGREYASRSKIKNASEEEIYDYCRDSYNAKKFMEGRLTASNFYTKTRRLIKLDIKYDEFYRIWNSIFRSIPEMEEAIRALKKRHPEIKLVLISNTNEEHYEFIKKEYEVLRLLDGYVVSHECGKIKPHPNIFKEALRLAGTLPRDTFYTDDRQDLIEAARVMGIRAFQFVGAGDFRRQLARCGVNI